MSLTVLECIEQTLDAALQSLINNPDSKLLVVGYLTRQVPGYLRKSKRIIFWTADEAVRASRIPKGTTAVLCTKFIKHKATLKIESLVEKNVIVLSNLGFGQINQMCALLTGTTPVPIEN